MFSIKNSLIKLIILLLFSMTCVSAVNAFEKSSLVWKRCVRCHANKGQLARIEDIRTTPEEWTVIIDRMHRLYGMPIKAGDMSVLLKELCKTQILSPEEEAPISYINLFNNSQVVEQPIDAQETQIFAACVRCHSAAKIYSYRRTKDAWAELRDFHIYVDPAIMYQVREMYWREEADKALGALARKYPYGQAWTAPEVDPEGDWLILGDEPGKGSYRGHASLNSVGDDEYTMAGHIKFSDGSSESFSGQATLYGGYALRTRSTFNGHATMGAFSYLDGKISGVRHHYGPDFRSASSSWFPMSDGSRVLRLSPAFLLAGEQTKVLIEGSNLPEVTKQDISLSEPGVTVLEASTTSPETIEVVLEYHGNTTTTADLGLKGSGATTGTLSLKLAPKIDFLAVSPQMGRARVNGGVNYPAEGVQFQAFAYSKGEDADDPADDILLGPVSADFTLAEYENRPGDDDLMHVGAISTNGSYVPSVDYNPIPARNYSGEGTGMVKVIARYTRSGDDFSADARLVVTVPDFIKRLK